MTYTVKQFSKDVGNSEIEALENNVKHLTAESITSTEGNYGSGILHIAFNTGNKKIVKLVVERVKLLENSSDVLRKLLSRIDYADITPLEILASQDDSVIKDILEDLFPLLNKELLQIILSDASSSFGNTLEHLIAVEGKVDSLMALVDYKIKFGIKFNTNSQGDYFYFELCKYKQYGVVSLFLDKISNDVVLKKRVLLPRDSDDEDGKALLNKIIIPDGNGEITDKAASLVSKIFDMADSVDELVDLFFSVDSFRIRIFLNNINLLPKLKAAKAFQNDTDNSDFVYFLTVTRLIYDLVNWHAYSPIKNRVLDQIENLLGTELTNQQYKSIFFIDFTRATLTVLLRTSSTHKFLRNTVCPKIANALAEDREIYLIASNLEYKSALASLKDNLEKIKALLPDNFEQCNPILTDSIKSIEFLQTARSLTDETVMRKDNNGDTILHAAFRIGEKNIVRVVLDKVKSLKNPNYLMKALLAIVNAAGFTPLEILANKDDWAIKDILEDLLSLHNEEFTHIILSDASSAFGNHLEHLLAINGKPSSLMELVTYKTLYDLEFSTNNLGNCFYDGIGETLLDKAITLYDANTFEISTLLSTIFSIVDSVAQLQSLFSDKALTKFVKEIDLLPELRAAKAFQDDHNNSIFVLFLVKTKLIDKLSATLDQGHNDISVILDAMATFIGIDLEDHHYKMVFYTHADAKQYSALTKLLNVTSNHDFLRNIVCPKIVKAIAAEHNIDLNKLVLEDANDLAALKRKAENIEALLPDNFEQCDPILTNFISRVTNEKLEPIEKTLNNEINELKVIIGNLNDKVNEQEDVIRTLKNEKAIPKLEHDEALKANARQNETYKPAQLKIESEAYKRSVHIAKPSHKDNIIIEKTAQIDKSVLSDTALEQCNALVYNFNPLEFDTIDIRQYGEFRVDQVSFITFTTVKTATERIPVSGVKIEGIEDYTACVYGFDADKFFDHHYVDPYTKTAHMLGIHEVILLT